jgi:carboxyl-terminal processing protease
MSESSESGARSASYRYLPLLSLLLVLASLGMLLRIYLSQPSDEHERRVAAFSAAIERIPAHYAGETSSEQLYHSAMRGMMRALDDPYSSYLNRYQMENMGVQTRGEFGGVGVMVSPRDGGAVIVDVQKDGPADAAKVKPGDVIVGVNGDPAGEMPFVQLVSLIRGKPGTTVELRLERAETGEVETVSIERARISTESVVSRRVEENIAYIQIRQFDGRSLDGVEKALTELKSQGELKGVLLDVRGNTGGLLDEAAGICDLFLKSGNIVSLDSRLEDEQKSYAADEEVVVPAEMPVVVLVDHRSASASEVLAGALQELGRATIIGTPTFGKGAVNRIMPLPDRSGILLTVAHYTVGDGKVIQDAGVEPDIIVGEVEPLQAVDSPDKRRQWLQKYRKAQERQFERAVEYLNQQ